MMLKTIPQIKAILDKKGYAFFDNDRAYNLNLIGERNDNGTVDKFDDYLHVIYKDDSLRWVHKAYNITTEPGLFWLKNYEYFNPDGTLIVEPGQYRGAYQIGLHYGYEALVQVKPVRGYRDGNKDDVIDLDPSTITEGLYGANIHKSDPYKKASVVGAHSAGCQVFADPKAYSEFMEIVKESARRLGNSFTYTLINESD